MNTSFWSHCQNLVHRLQQTRRGARPRRRQRTSWIVEGLEARTLLSSTPAMVADIAPGALSSNPSSLVAIGSTTYFSANDGVHGSELWKSDGTAGGTGIVSSSAVGPTNLTNVNGTLFFTAYDTIHGSELWKSDGTAGGTGIVSSSAFRPTNLTNVNGTLFFAADDDVNGIELWKSDGTAAGTTMVRDIFPGGTTYTGYYGSIYTSNSSSPHSLTNINGTLFFSASDSAGTELWKSDGTVAGTVKISNDSAPSYLTNVNGTLFFRAYDSADGYELWKSDGTAAGTTLIKDIYPGSTIYNGPYGAYSNTPNSSYPGSLTNVNGTLFFNANDGTHGYELWKSDGTKAGTTMVADINPGSAGSGPIILTNVNGTLFFSANDGTHGYELWKSDGTAAGTTMVADINPGSATSNPINLTNVNETLFFSANDGTHGYELWKSDGTSNGTVMLADINPGSASSYPGNFTLTNANGTLFFTANDGTHGYELWALNTAPAPSLAVSGFPATTTAGAAGSFTVVAKNADGTTNTSYTGTVHFTSTDPQAVLPADYTFAAADNGTHAFTANLKTAGYQSITATDKQTTGDTGIESGILVKSAAASTMTVGGFPSSTTAGVAGNLTITLKDPYGNVASGYTGTVHVSSTDAKATLPANYAFTAADAGKHTFSVTLKTAGTKSIKVVDTATSALIGTEGGITVTPAAASRFLISAPPSVKAGVPFSLTLMVEDVYGNVVTGYTG
ncbi:MAG TPA: ELWxxDGT repeat protein, partial [Gemmataceae bacterium]|nr:ELWxxDGT repeat protein [Gemmataceae bacterium]